MKNKLQWNSFADRNAAMGQPEQFLARCDNGELLLALWNVATEIDPRLKTVVRFRNIKGAPFDASYVHPGQTAGKRSKTHHLYIPRRVPVLRVRRPLYQIATLNQVAELADLHEGALTPAREHALALGHELGHVVLLEVQRANGIDGQRTWQEAMKTLPLGPWPASEFAINRSSAQRHLEQHRLEYLERYEVETAAELLVLQALAYRSLPDEKFADDFMAKTFNRVAQRSG